MKRSVMPSTFFSVALLAFTTVSVYAGEADVTDVKVGKSGNGVYDFSVEVSHADTGWDHYADKWDIVDEQDNVIATRTLHHPHVDEQPFTRSLGDVAIPLEIKEITIRAHDSVHGYGGRTMTVQVP